MSENPTDRRAVRIKVSAEESRKTAAARVQHKHRESELAIERERQKLALKREQRIARQQAKREKRSTRRHARTQFVARVNAIAPTAGRRAMITGPILAPMAVAWIGQIGFAHDKLGWPLLGALVFAAAWELTTAFTGWMYHQARKDGDRGALFRFATWLFACSAGAMNYWHACPVITERLNVQTVRQYVDLSPTPKAVSYGAMSLVGIALWELYSSLIHRKHLRAKGKVSSARPRFGVARWFRYPRITWTAWSLAIRYGITTVDDAWSAAVIEVERQDRARATRRRLKQAAHEGRKPLQVTVARYTVRPPKTRLRVYRVTDPTALQVTPQGMPQTVTPSVTQGTPRELTQGTPEVTGQGTPQITDQTMTQATPEAMTQATGEATPKTGRQGTRRATPKSRAKSRRTDNDLVAELQEIVAEHYRRHPGEEVNVKPVAKQLGIGRDRARRLLDQMNVRPIRRATTDPKGLKASEVKTG
jgi:hypothetical protein